MRSFPNVCTCSYSYKRNLIVTTGLISKIVSESLKNKWYVKSNRKMCMQVKRGPIGLSLQGYPWSCPGSNETVIGWGQPCWMRVKENSRGWVLLVLLCPSRLAVDLNWFNRLYRKEIYCRTSDVLIPSLDRVVALWSEKKNSLDKDHSSWPPRVKTPGIWPNTRGAPDYFCRSRRACNGKSFDFDVYIEWAKTSWAKFSHWLDKDYGTWNKILIKMVTKWRHAHVNA